MRSLPLLACLAAAYAAPVAHAAPAPPASWPYKNLELGSIDPEGGASALAQRDVGHLRYQYLSGGVNTGKGWTGYAQGGGSFVSNYIDDSQKNGFTPVFSYYQLFQSAPAGGSGDEKSAVLRNLRTPSTMKDYYADLRLFFQKAGEFKGQPVVLHLEPDLWGYVQTELGAATPAAVAASGDGDVAGLPNTAAGFAQAIVRLRNRYAPGVLLGWHLSAFGAGIDIAQSDPDEPRLHQAAQSAVAYYKALGANFDLIFAEFTDRDTGYAVANGSGPNVVWTPEDFARQVRFLGDFTGAVRRPAVMWQIPLGNTRMRAMNNTRFHYQDNKVEWLLDDPGRRHLATYRDAGVIAFLFGAAKDGATCACDAARDGVTNPPPLASGMLDSYSADDDGGFFTNRASSYYARGALPLAGAASTTVGASLFTLRGRIKWGYVFRGGAQKVDVTARASAPARVRLLVGFARLSRAGKVGKAAVRATRRVTLRPKSKRLKLSLVVPERLAAGRYALKIEVRSADGRRALQSQPNAAAFTVRR